MANVWGSSLRLSIFGESHGYGVGIIMDGLPSGIEIDMSMAERDMARRAPGGELVSARKEEDKVNILSGLYNGKTTGAPLCALIENKNPVSDDYTINVFRPGHADYTAHVKYRGYNDRRGGGAFSGRLTATLVFCGSIAKQQLLKENIIAAAHILQIGDVYDKAFDSLNVDKSVLEGLSQTKIPLLDKNKKEDIINAVNSVKENGDSIGGVIECMAIGLPVGLGEPFFYSVESALSSLLFSVPGVKGVSFGAGYSFGKMKGSEANDQYHVKNNRILCASNNSGGINGGITNGMPLLFTVAIRPTPSIKTPQKSVNANMEEEYIEVQGRHDPCIVLRAVPVIEACCYLCLYDLYLYNKMQG